MRRTWHRLTLTPPFLDLPPPTTGEQPGGGRPGLPRPDRTVGARPHGLHSDKMALITPDCSTMLHGRQMARVTSGCAGPSPSQHGLQPPKKAWLKYPNGRQKSRPRDLRGVLLPTFPPPATPVEHLQLQFRTLRGWCTTILFMSRLLISLFPSHEHLATGLCRGAVAHR